MVCVVLPPAGRMEQKPHRDDRHCYVTCEPSGGIGEGDFEVQASWEMNPESWEETEERRAGAWRGGAEHDQDDDDDARKRKWAEGEWP